jgi:hypothetical protein
MYINCVINYNIPVSLIYSLYTFLYIFSTNFFRILYIVFYPSDAILPVLYIGIGDLFLECYMDACTVSSLLLYVGLMMAHK